MKTALAGRALCRPANCFAIVPRGTIWWMAGGLKLRSERTKRQLELRLERIHARSSYVLFGEESFCEEPALYRFAR
jgi:hypothetical protein